MGSHLPVQRTPNLAQQYQQSGLNSAVQAAIRENGMLDKWANSSERWSSRLALGRGMDWAWYRSGLDSQKDTLLQPTTPLQPGLKDIAQSAVSYRQLLNLGKSAQELAQEKLINPRAFEYHTVAWKDALKPAQYTGAVQKNFANAFQPSTATQGLGTADYLLKHPDQFLKNTVVKDNFRRIADTLTTGKNPGSGIASAAGLGLFAYDLLASTHKTYADYKAAENGSWGDRIDTLRATGRTFITKALKNFTCWEVGTVGFAVGASLCCVGTAGAGLLAGAWLPIVGGVAVGALASTLTHKALNALIPETPSPEAHPKASSQLA